MSELEKKYSDFQTDKCKEEEQESLVIDPRICPTCIPNPNFKLSDDWWEIQEGYLNEAVCEYHIRVYEGEAKAEIQNVIRSGGLGPSVNPERDMALSLGITNLLIDLDKPVNDEIRNQLKQAAYVKDTFFGTRSRRLGKAFLIAVPAFNFDQIAPNDDEDAEEDGQPTDTDPTKEFIVSVEGLNRKLIQLRLSLNLYEQYYSLVQSTTSRFVIRRKDSAHLRINYGNIVKKINVFKNKLNEALKKSKYPKLNEPGFFTSKRALKIKFTFKDSDDPYSLKTIYVLPDDGCGQYQKLNIPSGNALRKKSMAVVFNLLRNLDIAINDITAKETMPWTDWTVKHIFPEHIIDYGNVEEIPDMQSGLQCLLEAQLGITGGQMIDTLTKEVMSAFSKAEQEMMKEACKARDQRIEKSSTTYAKNNNKEVMTAKEERKTQMAKRYEEQFLNKFYDYSIELLKESLPKKDKNRINKQNVFKFMLQLGHDFIKYETPEYKFKKDGKKIAVGGNLISVRDEDSLKTFAKLYATNKSNNLDEGSFGNQIANSPHYADALDASMEVVKKFDDTYVQATKDAIEGLRDIELTDFIPTIGVCGMSKIAGKALECLAKGLSFDDFMDILIEKTFDFMEVNTLSLFFNGLPISLREDLNSELQKQFGSGVNLEALFNIKNSGEPSQKLKDFVKSKEHGKRILGLFEAIYGFAPTSDVDRQYIESKLGPAGSEYYSNILKALEETGFDPVERTYASGEKTFLIEGKEKTFKRQEKYALKIVKKQIKDYKKSQKNFRLQMQRVGQAIGQSWDSTVEFFEDLPSDIAEGFSEIVDDIAEFAEDRSELRDKRDEIKDKQKELDEYRKLYSEASDERLDLLAELQDPEAPPDNERAINIEARVSELNVILNENQTKFEELKPKVNELQQEIDELNLYKQATKAIGETVSEAIEKSEIFETDLNEFEKAHAEFEATALGTKVDAIFDILFDFAIDYIMDQLDIDELFEMLRSYPAVDFAMDKIEGLLASCPSTPIVYPPPNEFLKSLTVDVCDPNFSLSRPKVNVPSINFRYNVERQFNEIFRETLIELTTNLIVTMLERLMSTLESSLCNLVEAAGGFVAEGIQEGNLGRSIIGFGNSFVDALNEAFCNDGDDAETSRKKAEQLADALFSPLMFDAGQNFEGSGQKVTNIIASVSSKNELMGAMVARPGEEDPQFNKRISTAITALAPEMESLLGSPDQVAYFFSNLGSYLSPEERKRIRDLLDAGIPNLPVSDAICLTNDQLKDWNDLRLNLLRDFPDPQSIIDDLNNKTLDALSDIMDDIGDLQTDGPFVGSMTNEALKDVCNPDNLFNDVSQSQFDKEQEDELTEAFFNNISRSLIRGFTGRNSVLGEALADKLGKKEFGRNFFKIFNPNYQNSQTERDNKYDKRGRVGRFLMDLSTVDKEAVGVYPPTVAISQRKKILDENGKSYNFTKVKEGKRSSKNIVYRYTDALDGSTYRVAIAASNLRRPKKVFGYNLQVIEKVGEEKEYPELNFNVPVSITEAQSDLMKSFGFDYRANEDQDIRKSAFNSFMRSKVPIRKKYDKVYEDTFEMINVNLVESLLTSAGGSIPNGYQFGYVDEQLTTESFVYTPSENEEELGTFADTTGRIVPLDPKIYGGRYSNPPYYIEPRQFTGWIEIAVKAFDSDSGCDPKKPPLISFQDIAERTKNLNSSLRNDPRLSKDPECVSVKPFHLLIDSKNKAKMDGVVRTTIRAYVAEYFIKGYGLFSNMEIRDENFDASLFLYIVSKMKSEMLELGTQFSNKKIRIARERYWYTFLEQCVETYQTKIDVDGFEPPENIMATLVTIQKGMDKFVPVDRRMKKKMKELLRERGTIPIPNSDYNPLKVLNRRPAMFALQSVAFRLTTDLEERENFFKGQEFSDIEVRDIRRASLKKLRFFQKIYFIKLYEKEAIQIMSELVKEEVARFAGILNDGLSDKPYYREMYKSFFGMSSIFTNSTSKVGLNEYYSKKQTNGSANAGQVPTTMSNNTIGPVTATDKPQLILESYVRLQDKEDQDLIMSNRAPRYKGVVSLDDMSDFVDDNIELLEGKKLSDFFGDLSFVYSGSFLDLLKKGFVDNESIQKLSELNKDTDVNIALLQNSLRTYISGLTFEDFDVIYDESFVIEGDSPKIVGTKGKTGVSYGLRICMVMKSGFYSDADILSFKQQLPNISKREKSYVYDDGTFVVPLVSQEIDVVDSSFDEFDPFSGVERYDLECLINKMVKQDDFMILFDKMFNMRQASSMLAMYCIESLLPSIGRDEEERINPDLIADIDDAWDGTINKFAKNFLRREFKSLYLSGTADGNSDDEEDDASSRNLLAFGNPFDSFNLPAIKIPWWFRRRLKTKIYDADRVECVDPKKDLE